MIIKQTQVQELQSQAQRLKTIEPEKEQEIEAKRVMIEEKFKKIQEPLLQKRAQLEKGKKIRKKIHKKVGLYKML